MARGDQIYVMRPLGGMQGVYEHHGIDCGDGTVIHYRKPENREPIVSRSTLAEFAKDSRIYLKRHATSMIADNVIDRAESRLGERLYDLFSNNCEHFATWCKTGRNESAQLARFGLGTGGFTPTESRQLIEQATQEASASQAMSLLQQALGNIAIAQQQILPQYTQVKTEMDTWHRVAELALKQGKESVARAALERKVKYKQQAAELKVQLDQLNQMQADLMGKMPELKS